MKKIVLILMVMLMLTGCTKTYTISKNNIKAKDVKYISIYPQVYEGEKIENRQQIEKVLSFLAQIDLVEIERPKKDLYGGFGLVIKTDDKDITVFTNGIFLSIDEKCYQTSEELDKELYSLIRP